MSALQLDKCSWAGSVKDCQVYPPPLTRDAVSPPGELPRKPVPDVKLGLAGQGEVRELSWLERRRDVTRRLHDSGPKFH
jgi:hypothetical protein